MKAHWWSCVLGLFCMPAEVILSEQQAVQKPSTIFSVKINSSVEIMCSTSLLDPLSLSLRRKFQRGNDDDKIVFLSLKNGVIQKTLPATEFTDRIHINRDTKAHGMKHGFTLQLSLLGLKDTDLYFCHWTYFDSSISTLTSNGTVIIVRESLPQDDCGDPTLDFSLITLSVTALTAVLFICTGAIICSRRKFRKKFKPARAMRPPIPDRPRHTCPQEPPHHCPYLITYGNRRDFRGIL